MPSPTDQLLQKAVDRLGEWAAILQNPPEDFGLNPMRVTVVQRFQPAAQ